MVTIRQLLELLEEHGFCVIADVDNKADLSVIQIRGKLYDTRARHILFDGDEDLIVGE